MIVDLRSNPQGSQLPLTRIKYREVRSKQIVHKKRHFLTIRYVIKELENKLLFLLCGVCDLRPSLRTHEKGKHFKKKNPSKPSSCRHNSFSYPAMFDGK